MPNYELRKHKTADAVKWVVVFLLVIGLIGAVITLFVMLDRQTTVTEIGAEAYKIAALNEDGEEVESDKSIVTRNAFTTDGMTVVFDADAKVTYKLYFYDEDEKLLSATDDLAEDYSGTIPEKAVWAKAVITPTEDEDGKVSLTEVFGYASALTITVNR